MAGTQAGRSRTWTADAVVHAARYLHRTAKAFRPRSVLTHYRQAARGSACTAAFGYATAAVAILGPPAFLPAAGVYSRTAAPGRTRGQGHVTIKVLAVLRETQDHLTGM